MILDRFARALNYNTNHLRPEPASAMDIGGADGITFADWRQGLYPEREHMVKETHARTGYPLPEYARITHMTRIFPSEEDEFRASLVRTLAPELGSAKSLFGHDDRLKRREAGKTWIATLRPAIAALGPNSGLSGDPQVDRVYKIARTLNEDPPFEEEAYLDRAGQSHRGVPHAGEESDSILESAPQIAARRQILKLDALFENGPLRIDEVSLGIIREVHPHATTRNFVPYKPTGQERFRWYNFWQLDGAASPRRRLRMNWELFGRSQNFTIIEDFKQAYPDYEDSDLARLGPSAEASERGFFVAPGRRAADKKRARSGAGAAASATLGSQVLNFEWTAADTLNAELKRHFAASSSPFAWTGHLAVAAHYWIFPIEHLLESIASPDRAAIQDALRNSVGRNELAMDQSLHAKLSETLTAFAKDVFAYPDKTSYDEPRKDFVVSRIAAGRAILISDLRPYSRSDERWELASRTVILDIALKSEQRGRLIKRCTDIASARTLALRDFLYVDAISSTINEIGHGVSQCYAQILEAANTGPPAMPNGIWEPSAPRPHRHTKQERDAQIAQFSETLLRLRQLSTNLGALNNFMTYGITGAQLASRDYRLTVQERATSLREDRLPGFQSLGGFLSRFYNTAATIDRMAQRYDTLRRRIAEYSQLVRAEIELLELESLDDQAREQTRLLGRADVLGGGALYVALLAFYHEAMAAFPNAAGFAMLAVGTIGLLSGGHFLWKLINARGVRLPKPYELVGLLMFLGFLWWLNTLG